jgi:hypothetical protein
MTEPAILVRGSSRRMMSMRFRPANIRLINRRADRLDRHLCCLPLIRIRGKPKPKAPAPSSGVSLTMFPISEQQLETELQVARRKGTASLTEKQIVQIIVVDGSQSAPHLKIRVVEKVKSFGTEL